MKRNSLFALIWITFLAHAGLAQAVDLRKLPPCPDADGRNMRPNNEQVFEWKKSTPDHFTDRGFVVGTIAKVLKPRNGHIHFDMAMDGFENDPRGHVEIIYNEKFGDVPELREGAEVVACGDYITTLRKGRYPPSPMGAIVHWVHMSPRRDLHVSGFLAIDGMLTGDENPNDGGGRY